MFSLLSDPLYPGSGSVMESLRTASDTMRSVHAQVVVLAGPSGAGKSRLAQRLGLPVLRLDDFYKDGTDATLPLIANGPNRGLVDWDDPASWHLDDALGAVRELCETGRAQVPIYDIAHDERTGWQSLDLGAHRLFVAEGIFAQDVVPALRQAGQLAAAYCVTQWSALTFWRRLTRDLRERRKPPRVLIRRGLELMRTQSRVVGRCAARGCTVATPSEAYGLLRHLLTPGSGPAMPWGPSLRQPDGVSCGAASAVVARMLRDQEYAAEALPRFGPEVLAVHRSFRGWPRRWGTAYWSVEHRLALAEGCRYVLRPAYLGAGRAFDRLHAAASSGRLAALYVGTRSLPKHVTLVVGVRGTDLRIYDPADGALHTVSRQDFTGATLTLGGWRRPWTIVVPAGQDRRRRYRAAYPSLIRWISSTRRS